MSASLIGRLGSSAFRPSAAAVFQIYPGAPHGFVADYRPSYRKEAAEDAWAKMIAWFKKYDVLS